MMKRESEELIYTKAMYLGRALEVIRRLSLNVKIMRLILLVSKFGIELKTEILQLQVHNRFIFWPPFIFFQWTGIHEIFIFNFIIFCVLLHLCLMWIDPCKGTRLFISILRSWLEVLYIPCSQVSLWALVEHYKVGLSL